MYAWGIGSNHQLGLGAEDDVYEPVLLTGAQVKNKEVLKVNSGGQHTLFLVDPQSVIQSEAMPADTKLNEPSNTNGTTAAKPENGVAANKKKAAASKKK